MGAEIATGTVIGKGVGLAAKGMEKVAIRQTEKAAAKGITHVAESQAAKQLQRSGARAIEREATAMSRQ